MITKNINTSKFSNWLLALCLVFGFSKSIAQGVTVDFVGRISNDNQILPEAIIQVLQNGKLLTSFKTDKDGSYNIYLPLGAEYIITVSKDNYVQKYFSVSTTGIPADKAKDRFPIFEANIDLFKFYEGVDYSLFNEPINKYYYNAKIDNIEYDKEYLKEMIAAMKLIKKAEKEAILLALQKNDAKQKQLQKLANQKTEATTIESEKLAIEKKNLEERLANQTTAATKTPIENKDVKLNIVVADAKTTKKITDKRINDLLLKYKEGITEEIIEGNGIVIIKRVLVRSEEVWVYEKKIFNWGGVSYFRDRQSITASTFEVETALVSNN